MRGGRRRGGEWRLRACDRLSTTMSCVGRLPPREDQPIRSPVLLTSSRTAAASSGENMRSACTHSLHESPSTDFFVNLVSGWNLMVVAASGWKTAALTYDGEAPSTLSSSGGAANLAPSASRELDALA